MKQVSILEPNDKLHPDDWVRPLTFLLGDCGGDAPQLSSTYGGGPQDHSTWAPAWLTYGSCHWGKPLRQIEMTIRPVEVIRGDIPVSHRLPLEDIGWHRRHPLYYERNLKEWESLRTSKAGFGRWQSMTWEWIQQCKPDYWRWVRDNHGYLFSTNQAIKRLTEIGDLEVLKVWYHPEYKKFIKPKATKLCK